MSVVQRADADGVACGDKLLLFIVVDYHRKFRIELFEHLKPVLMIQRQYDLAVGLALEAVFYTKLLAELSEAVQLAVADYSIVAEVKRLHTAFIQTHY